MYKRSDWEEQVQALWDKSFFCLEPALQPSINDKTIKQYFEIMQLFFKAFSSYLTAPETFMQWQTWCWKKAWNVFPALLEEENSQEMTSSKLESMTFQNPFLEAFEEQYYSFKHYVLDICEKNSPYSGKAYQQRQFIIKQLLDAISPKHFFWTNPEAIQTAIQTEGKSFIHGMQQFIQDMAGQRGIQHSPAEAFKVGVNIATTEGSVVYRNDMMELIAYYPQTNRLYELPLLLIPPWINKYYILDLRPENSLISWSVQQGIPVFVISWINPGPAYKNKGLEDYLTQGPLAAIKVIQQRLKIKHLNALGFCIGGTLLACTLAYLKAINQEAIRSATLLAAMIDFQDPGELSLFVDEDKISEIEAVMKQMGYLDGRYMANTFNLLKANDLIWSFYIKHYLLGKVSMPFDVLHWNADLTNMPEKMQSEYLRWMYFKNDLIKPGGIVMNHQALNIQSIDVDSFFVGTEKDHIAPWRSVYQGFLEVNGNKEFLLGESGHIMGIINPPSTQKYGFYYQAAQKGQAPEGWLKEAHYQQGSWWPYWMKWLKKRSGKKVSAAKLSKWVDEGLVAAPGEYVHQSYQTKVETAFSID